MNLYINQLQKKPAFRERVYAGDIFLDTNLRSAHELCALARHSITEAFDGETDHLSLHKKMPVETFVDHVTRLKRNFTNGPQAKALIRDYILEIGADPQDYLFDVPRVRVVPNYDYLHAGVSYAYKPHRDTWYGNVDCQLNTWMPIYSIEPEQTMMINPAYFTRPVQNSSHAWSLTDWIKNQRFKAKDNITQETRVHPVPMEAIDDSSEIRIAGNSGEILMFSGTHLHGTVANHTDRIRFSVDFRLIHLQDLIQKRGAPNVDNGCFDVEAGFKDLFHASDFSQFQGVNP